jgi:hypothetical protein
VIALFPFCILQKEKPPSSFLHTDLCARTILNREINIIRQNNSDSRESLIRSNLIFSHSTIHQNELETWHCKESATVAARNRLMKEVEIQQTQDTKQRIAMKLVTKPLSKKEIVKGVSCATRVSGCRQELHLQMQY